MGRKRLDAACAILYAAIWCTQMTSLAEAASRPDRAYEQLVRQGVHRRGAAPDDGDDLGPPPDPGDGWWNTTYEINGQQITLGEVDTMLRGARPK